MNWPLLKILFFSLLLLPACKRPKETAPAGPDEVLAVQDSIRNVLLFRIGRAQQEINRQLEAMNNRAYNADKATARRLSQKIAAVEKAYARLEEQIQRIENDSLMAGWILLRQETELIIMEASRELGTPL